MHDADPSPSAGRRRTPWMISLAWLAAWFVPAATAVALGPDGRPDAGTPDAADVLPLIEALLNPEPIELEVPLSPAVSRLLESPIPDEPTKQRLRVEHGAWDDLKNEELPTALRARLAYLRGDLAEARETLDHAQPEDQPLARYWLAQVQLERGLVDQAEGTVAAFVDQPPAGVTDTELSSLRGRIAEARGDFAGAVAQLTPIRERFLHDTSQDPDELTAAARAIALLAELEGRPASDYRRAITLLDAAVEADPLYWPARLAQAELLYAKDNPGQAEDALNEVLSLNPRGAAAMALGINIAIDRWNFAGAAELITHLEQQTPGHPVIPGLKARRAIRANELKLAEELLREQPEHAHALDWPSWRAALAARQFDDDAVRAFLEQRDQTAPGHPGGHLTVASVLSTARQYDRARGFFEEAVRRQPNAAAPRLELGLMLMQLGDLPAARDELAAAARLDPFHAGVNNSLDLVETMLAWPAINTDHFVIRHAPGPDAALARDLPPVLETIRDDLAAELGEAFGQVTDDHPHGPIQIDLLPDSQTFAVRITGQSELGALAACTGDVLAMTPPRLGAAQTGVYHWADVLRHEYVHAILFDLSHHLCPRWFHEGTATHFEQLERTYETQQMLAQALAKDELIPFDELEAAFGTRRIGFAYQQSGWMIEYLVETHGNRVLNDMLAVYAQAGDDADALRRATGQSPEAFMSAFLEWADAQANAWGLNTRPLPDEVRTLLAGPDGDEPGDAEALGSAAADLATEPLDAWVEADPDHPTLLRLLAQRALNDPEMDDAHVDATLERYAAARPSDPWPRRQLAARALARGDTDAAIEVLTWLDRRELHDAQWAIALADLYRRHGDYAAAYGAVESALFREPYNASFRELAATVALQDRDFASAAFQIRALIDLEPTVELHQRRLEAVEKWLGQQPPG